MDSDDSIEHSSENLTVCNIRITSLSSKHCKNHKKRCFNAKQQFLPILSDFDFINTRVWFQLAPIMGHRKF